MNDDTRRKFMEEAKTKISSAIVLERTENDIMYYINFMRKIIREIITTKMS